MITIITQPPPPGIDPLAAAALCRLLRSCVLPHLEALHISCVMEGVLSDEMVIEIIDRVKEYKRDGEEGISGTPSCYPWSMLAIASDTFGGVLPCGGAEGTSMLVGVVVVVVVMIISFMYAVRRQVVVSLHRYSWSSSTMPTITHSQGAY